MQAELAKIVFEADYVCWSQPETLDLVDIGERLINHDAMRFYVPGMDYDKDAEIRYSSICFEQDCYEAIESLDWAFDYE